MPKYENNVVMYIDENGPDLPLFNYFLPEERAMLKTNDFESFDHRLLKNRRYFENDKELKLFMQNIEDSSFDEDRPPPSEELFVNDSEEYMYDRTLDAAHPFVPRLTQRKRQLLTGLAAFKLRASDTAAENETKITGRLELIRGYCKELKRKRYARSYKRFNKVRAKQLDLDMEARDLFELELVDKQLNRPFYYADTEPFPWKMLLFARQKAIRKKFLHYLLNPQFRQSYRNQIYFNVNADVPDDLQKDDQEKIIDSTVIPSIERPKKSKRCCAQSAASRDTSRERSIRKAKRTTKPPTQEMAAIISISKPKLVSSTQMNESRVNIDTWAQPKPTLAPSFHSSQTRGSQSKPAPNDRSSLGLDAFMSKMSPSKTDSNRSITVNLDTVPPSDVEFMSGTEELDLKPINDPAVVRTQLKDSSTRYLGVKKKRLPTAAAESRELCELELEAKQLDDRIVHGNTQKTLFEKRKRAVKRKFAKYASDQEFAKRYDARMRSKPEETKKPPAIVEMRSTDTPLDDSRVPTSEEEYMSDELEALTPITPDWKKPLTTNRKALLDAIAHYETLTPCQRSKYKADMSGSNLFSVRSEFNKRMKLQNTRDALRRFLYVQTIVPINKHAEMSRKMCELELNAKQLDRGYYYASDEPQEYTKLMNKRRKAIQRKFDRYAKDEAFRVRYVNRLRSALDESY